ncbi:bacterio-opsin activator domain-containing protein [Halospeciosus flavus]|uniref:Bacterio-opsin activator domain-containing protein n=2 Tax=Halospeciosus flavus TaxID=3032283 RepID=A0ABD5Z6H0_9EURY|nr:bacterio-opsin activator domain-containing protein [Halospeciosus flavus]
MSLRYTSSTDQGEQEEMDTIDVEFAVEDDTYPFVGASANASCVVDLQEMVPRGDGSYSEFFRVEGADSERVLTLAEETPRVDPTLIESSDGCALFEFVVEEECVAATLADEGAFPRVVRGEEGEGTLVAEVPQAKADDIVESFLDNHPDVELVDQRDSTRMEADFTVTEFIETAHEILDSEKRELVVAALSEGYYDWPRTRSIEELAEQLNQDASILRELLHEAEQELLAALFDDGDLDHDEHVHPLIDADVPGG